MLNKPIQLNLLAYLTTGALTSLKEFEEGKKLTGFKRTAVQVKAVELTEVVYLLNELHEWSGCTTVRELQLTIHKTHQYHQH